LLRIARGIAAAAEHLLGLGIMHGDLYGHNILHGADGRTLLGDFGAASFYQADKGELAKGLERLEVRAFGCLLEELINRCAALDAGSRQLAQLIDLKSDCLSESTEARPLFDEIFRKLSNIWCEHELHKRGVTR
jgi:serine/threonine protein kinase